MPLAAKPVSTTAAKVRARFFPLSRMKKLFGDQQDYGATKQGWKYQKYKKVLRAIVLRGLWRAEVRACHAGKCILIKCSQRWLDLMVMGQ
jgi:hypothetical protein